MLDKMMMRTKMIMTKFLLMYQNKNKIMRSIKKENKEINIFSQTIILSALIEVIKLSIVIG